MDHVYKFLKHFFDMEEADYRRIAKIITRAVMNKKDTKERLRQEIVGIE